MKYLKTIKAKTLWQKTRGLIGAKKPYSLLIQTRFGIHTFGLKFPIDIIILDNNTTIKTLKENLKPNRLYFWNPKYHTIIELPAKAIRKNNFTIGEKIAIKED